MQLRVFDHPLEGGRISVQLPTGTVEPGETPEVAVLRELHEEVGVVAHTAVLASEFEETVGGERRRRSVFRIDVPTGLPHDWVSECDCGTPIQCHWLPMQAAQLDPIQQGWRRPISD